MSENGEKIVIRVTPFNDIASRGGLVDSIMDYYEKSASRGGSDRFNDYSTYRLVGNPNNVFVCTGSVLCINDCVIYGNYNLIIGHNNIICGGHTLTIGEKNTWISGDLDQDVDEVENAGIEEENVGIKLENVDLLLKSKGFKMFMDIMHETYLRGREHEIKRALCVYEDFIKQRKNLNPAKQLKKTLLHTPSRFRSEPYNLRSRTRDSDESLLNKVEDAIQIWIQSFDALTSSITTIEALDFELAEMQASEEEVFLNFHNRVKRKFRNQPIVIESDNEDSSSQENSVRLFIPADSNDRIALSLLQMMSPYARMAMREVPAPERPKPPPIPTKLLPEKILPFEPEAAENEKQCLICCTRSVKTVVVPCGHSYSCVECCHNPDAKQICACCNNPFLSIIRLYEQ